MCIIIMQDYDISTLYLGCHRDGVRKVCIKFDIESDAFELDFDTFTKGLDPNNQPPDIMRKSIKVHREPTSLTAKGIATTQLAIVFSMQHDAINCKVKYFGYNIKYLKAHLHRSNLRALECAIS